MARGWRLLTPVPVVAVLVFICALSTGALAAGKAGDDKTAAPVKETRAKERPSSPVAAPWGDSTTTSAPPPPHTALNQEPSKEPASSGGWDLFGSLFGGAGSA